MENKKILIIESVVFLIIIIFLFVCLAPNSFPKKHFLSIENGLSSKEIAIQLKNEKIIKSEMLFNFLIKIKGKDNELKSGEYWLDKKLSIFDVIKRLTTADFGNNQIKITIPEGFTIKDIAELFNDFDKFNKEQFLKEASNVEGYLFPETYFFLPNATSGQVILKAKETFNEKVGNIDYKVLIMASIIEKEVHNAEDRRVVSGILWKRLKIGMLLQVDAASETYLKKGLPLTPICNPGLDAIDATLNPRESQYLFYLSAKDGTTYFAKTFEEHKLNIKKYLTN